jgi:hypothetical protein
MNTTAEVGTDPAKRRGYQALTIDRAVATGKPLDDVVNNPYYYPGKTTRQTATTGQAPDMSIWEGANPANFATGNASYDPVKQRYVGFAGGPQTTSFGTTDRGSEYGGIEGGTLPYARAMGYQGPERTAIGPTGPRGAADDSELIATLSPAEREIYAEYKARQNRTQDYPAQDTGRQQGPKMPTSLLDMFQPTDPSGAPVDFNTALQQRSNSLIGLGMGLMSPAWQGESVIGNALKGFQSGAGLDARQQALREATSERKQQQSNWERQFARSGESDWARIARELQLKPGSPEYLQGAKQYYQGKTEGDWTIQTDEDTGRPYALNKRTLETKPIAVPGAVAPGATAAAPGAEPVPGAIPPAPPGVDRKEWKREQTKLAVQQQIARDAAKKAGLSIDPVAEDIDRSIAQISKYPGMTTGGFSNVLKKIPLVGSATQAGEVESLINTIKSSSSLEKLQQMKAQSPTGASGLGAVTQGEHKLLQDAIGNLDQSQDASSVLYNLERIKRIRHEIIHGPGTAPPPRFAPPSYQQTPGAGAAPAGSNTRVIGGKTYRKLNGQWFED